MVELKTELAQVGEYDGYLVEVGYPNDLGGDDQQTAVLDAHLAEIGESIGKDNVYVRPLGPEASQNFLNRLNSESDVETMPWLILLTQHPDELEPGEEILTLQLGELEDEEAVIATMREAVEKMNSEEFVRESSPSRRVELMRNSLPYVAEGLTRAGEVGGVVTLIQLLP